MFRSLNEDILLNRETQKKESVKHMKLLLQDFKVEMDLSIAAQVGETHKEVRLLNQ
jgi:hypothetical protein